MAAPPTPKCWKDVPQKPHSSNLSSPSHLFLAALGHADRLSGLFQVGKLKESFHGISVSSGSDLALILECEQSNPGFLVLPGTVGSEKE